MNRRQHGYRYPRPAAIDPLQHNRNVRSQKRFRSAVLATIAYFQTLTKLVRSATTQKESR